MKTQELENRLKSLGNTFIEKFEERAEILHDKVFFYYGEIDKGYTYRQFNELANCIANNLIILGFKKGDRVSLFLSSPVATTLSMFAIWKIGAVFCPINYNYKGKMLAYHINDTRPGLLITEQKFLNRINHIKNDIQPLPVVLHQPKKNDHDFDSEAAFEKLDTRFKQVKFEELLSGDTSNPGTTLDYSDTANIIYTSGTTGNPKGVIQPHRYLHNYLYNDLNLAHPDDVIYNDLPLYHVGGAFYNVVRAAWAGCKIAVWDKFSPKNFWKRIRKCNGTNAVLLDVMIPWLAAREPASDDRNNSLKSVTMQPLPANHRDIARRFGIDFVSVGYGSTEAGAVLGGRIVELQNGEGTPDELHRGYTRDQIIHLCKKHDMGLIHGSEKVENGFLGKPSILHDIAILDDKGQPAAPGMPGQLALRPKLPSLIFKEYFRKPDATAEAVKEGWYYSGDIIVQKEGSCCFVDRIGGFIRSRGENMSSHQVEGIINSHPDIKNSAVFSVDAVEGGEEDIAAFIVLKQDVDISQTGLRNWMKNEMPKYMVPKYLRFVDSLPTTPTFKVEKYKLKQRILQELELNA